MEDVETILEATDTVLVVDWPSQDVPETLARAGFTVIVQGGPGPEDYSTYECSGDAVIARRTGTVPEHVDLIYAHRPMEELPGLVARGEELGAKAIWLQSGLAATGTRDSTGCWVPEEELRMARQLVESGGLAFFHEPYIAEAVRQLRRSRPSTEE
jgi:predicted CoA-binding protein